MCFLMERIIFHPIEKLHALKFFDKLSAYVHYENYWPLIPCIPDPLIIRYMSISPATCSQAIAKHNVFE